MADDSPAELITAKIASLGDWRAELLKRLRELILAADDGVVETWKWNVPVWECAGILCTGETYKAKVKLTFAHGAALDDPQGLFNSSLDGKVRRAIDLGPEDPLDAAAFTALIRAAAKHNRAKAR